VSPTGVVTDTRRVSAPAHAVTRRRTLSHWWIPQVVRLASHATTWTLVIVPTVIQMAHGWRPTRDDAMISIGSYNVLSAHSPTVGAWSQASQGLPHAFYDIGPLLFWLLAIPVRLDPGQGAMWGAALVCGIALSLSVEAAWSVRGWPAAVAMALIAADLGWQTQVFADLVWNPHFGLVFMTGAAATGWAVVSGRVGWWPLTVLFASVAAQCHLLYAVPAVGLALLAPVVALALDRRPSRWRWLVAGVVVGAVCWAVPLGQQVFGHPGNLSLVAGSGSSRPRVGAGFGLHALATAVSPRPVWLSTFPFLTVPHFLHSHSGSWAVASVVFLVAVAAGAGLARRRELAALALVALVLCVGTAVSFGALPRDDVIVVAYLAIYLWVVGAVVWIVVLWGAGELVVTAARRLGGVDHRVGWWAPWAVGCQLAVTALLVVVAMAGVRTLIPAAHSRVAAVGLDRPLDEAIARSVAGRVGRGPVAVTIRPASFGPAYGYFGVDDWGMAFVLLTEGRHPGLTNGFYGPATHLTVPPGSHWTHVTVTVDPASKTVAHVTVDRAALRAAPR
jgi:hypothetical protein